MKFYLDEDLSPVLAEQLRRHGIDAVSAHEVEMARTSDAGQLAFAARERRCLVTKNVRHFIDLSKRAVALQEPHAGIALCPPSLQGSEIGVIVARFVRISEHYRQGLGPYDVIYL